MIKATPRVVAAVLTALVSVTCTSYIFFGDSFGGGPPEFRQAGMWGPVTSDFDWCEPNHMVLDWIAEPWNTFSSTAFFIPAIVLSAKPLPGMGFLFWVLTACLVAVGLGSFVFHATLKYETQLLDEVPMYALVLTGATVTFYRHAQRPNPVAVGIAGVWLVSLCTVLWTVPREHLLHRVLHDTMSATFSICMVTILTMTGKVASEAADAAVKAGMPKTAESVERAAGLMFIAFVVAIVCWGLDNSICVALHNLPGGMPYPQLHAIVWHGGTAIGCYQIVVVLLTHRYMCVDKLPVAISWPLPIFPVVRAVVKSA